MIDSKLDERDKRILILAVTTAVLGTENPIPYEKRQQVLRRVSKWMDDCRDVVLNDPTTDRPSSHVFLDLLDKIMDEPSWDGHVEP